MSRRFHGFVVGPPGSSETLHPGEKCGIQEISGQIQGIWRDVVNHCDLHWTDCFSASEAVLIKEHDLVLDHHHRPKTNTRHNNISQHSTVLPNMYEHVGSSWIFMDLHGSSSHAHLPAASKQDAERPFKGTCIATTC